MAECDGLENRYGAEASSWVQIPRPPQITDPFHESIEAWDMGPVVGTLWRSEHEEAPRSSGVSLSEAELNTIGYVLSRYGGLTGRDLEILSHDEDPWRDADALRRQRGDGAAPVSNAALEAFVRLKDSLDQRTYEGDVVLGRELAAATIAVRERYGAPSGAADDEDRLRSRVAGFTWNTVG